MKNTKSIKQVNKFFAFWLRLFRIQSLSVYQLTLSMLIITAIFSVGLTFIGWTYTETLRIKTKINELKSTTLNKQKEKLKVEVSRLISYLEYIQKDTNHHTLEQLKEEALLYFENLRFGNDGYVFVNTYDGIALLFDGQKLNEIKTITDLVDPNGFKIFEKELDLAKLPEGGSFQYLFKKIYTATPQPKLSFVMGFDDWEWIIGTGDYLDNIEDEVNILEQDLKKDMYRNIRIAFGIFASVLIVLIGAAYWFATWIQDQFTKFVRILKQASLKKNNEQVLDRIFIRELKTIGFEILQAEELAKEFGDIIDQSANEIYIFDRDSFKFVHVNKGAVKNCGYSLSELQGMTPLDIKPKLNFQQFQDLVEPIIQKNTNRVHFETVHQRKDKSSYPVDIHLTLSFFKEKPVFIAFVYDISERKEAENQLHLSQQRYSNLFENAPISLWEEDFSEVIEYLDQQIKHYKLDLESLFDQHPEFLFQCAALVKITDVNNQTLSLFEAKNKEELLGNLNKLFTENSILSFEQSLLALYKGEKQFSSEAENLTLKGKKLDVLLRWSFLAKDDKPSQKVIVSIVDLTELKKAEEELKTHRNRLEEIVNDRTSELEESQNALLNLVDDLNRKSKELETSNIRLAEINEELETFTYSVSHDLKAPLRGIDGYSQLLFDSYGKNIDKDAREFLLNIRKSTQQMNLLIEDLLAYSRMERKTFESKSIQFKPIIDNLLLAYSKTITENNVQIKRSFSDDFMLVGDKDGLSLVLRNLLDNALKFSFNNKTIQIEIGARESDTHWHIFVKDNGIGFDMKYHDRIFKIFQRLHLPEEFEGTGIGLAMVYKAVQRMNGKIWGKSETGKGTCFNVEIKKS